jgi:hypothetical protein
MVDATLDSRGPIDIMRSIRTTIQGDQAQKIDPLTTYGKVLSDIDALASRMGVYLSNDPVFTELQDTINTIIDAYKSACDVAGKLRNPTPDAGLSATPDTPVVASDAAPSG